MRPGETQGAVPIPRAARVAIVSDVRGPAVDVDCGEQIPPLRISTSQRDRPGCARSLVAVRPAPDVAVGVVSVRECMPMRRSGPADLLPFKLILHVVAILVIHNRDRVIPLRDLS